MRTIYLIAIGLLILLGGAVGAYTYKEKVLAPAPEVTVCTQEAKICPDGSAVGRTGPHCEFAECPQTPAPEKESTTVGIGETAYTFGVHITPTALVEDSRCPQDVQCIQAGTVRVKVTLESEGGTQTVTLTQGSPINFVGKRVVLMDVTPVKNSKKTISPQDYRFTFHVGYGMGGDVKNQ